MRASLKPLAVAFLSNLGREPVEHAPRIMNDEAQREDRQ